MALATMLVNTCSSFASSAVTSMSSVASVKDNGNVAGLCQWPERCHHHLEELGDVHRFKVQVAAVLHGDGEHVLNEPAQAVRVPGNDVQHLPDAVGNRPAGAVLDHVQVSGDGGQRCPELMVYGGQEVGLGLVQLP